MSSEEARFLRNVLPIPNNNPNVIFQIYQILVKSIKNRNFSEFSKVSNVEEEEKKPSEICIRKVRERF